MSFTLYDASAPIFVASLRDMSAWLNKAAAEKSEAELMQARLAPDMRPLPSQFQFASDTAKNAMARLAGVDALSMPDTETSFAELKDRCARTIDYVQSFDPAVIAASEERAIALRFPNGTGFDFNGRAYLTGFALPNFFFHVTTAYDILRHKGLPIGKRDFMGPVAALDT
jgi:hypothetical protein